MDAFHQQAQLFNRFTVAAIMCSEPVVTVVRRELRRLFPDLKVVPENLKALIEQKVIKCETVEGDKAKGAATRIKRAGAKLERARKKEVVANCL